MLINPITKLVNNSIVHLNLFADIFGISLNFNEIFIKFDTDNF
jgi:hypothetical protein